jgi:hypothetical protein
MKGFLSASGVALLLSVVLFTSSCAQPSGQAITCFENLALKVVASVVSDTEPLTFADLLDVAPECISAVIAAFSDPSNSSPLSPEVDINTSPDDGSSTGYVYSNTWSNCTYDYQTLQFDFYVPFDMAVGGQSNQDNFNSSPGADSSSSNNELIATQLFEQFNTDIASVTTSGPSQSVSLDVPPETQIQLRLPIQLSYREGEARVVNTDGSTATVPWLYTDGYQQDGQITYTSSSC